MWHANDWKQNAVNFEADEAELPAQIERVRGQVTDKRRQHADAVARLKESVDEQRRL